MFLDCSDPLLQILQHFPLKQFNVVAGHSLWQALC